MKKTPEEYQEYRRRVVRASQKKWRALAKEKGLCSICCLRVPDPGRVTCKECRTRIIKANNRNCKKNTCFAS